MVGTSIAARFVMRWGSGRTMGLGAAAMALGGLVMVLLLAFTSFGAWGVIAAIGLYTDRHGHDLAQAQAGALLPFPDRAGAASSLLGLRDADLVGGGRRDPRPHARPDAWPLAIAMLLAGGLSLLLWTLRACAQRRA